jgi:hypothetical protein
MGGFGSGTWNRFGKMLLTKEAICLDINYLARRRLLTTQPRSIRWLTSRAVTFMPGEFIPDDEYRSIRWLTSRAVTAWAEVFFGENIEEPILFVRMHCPSDPDDDGTLYVIPIKSTRQRLGGCRWWLCCCLCGRKVAKLYMPAGKVNWGCRSCHDLTYRTCQEAHQAERLRISFWHLTKTPRTRLSRKGVSGQL